MGNYCMCMQSHVINCTYLARGWSMSPDAMSAWPIRWHDHRSIFEYNSSFTFQLFYNNKLHTYFYKCCTCDPWCMFHVESQRRTVIDFVCKRFVPPSSNQSNDHDTNDDNHTVKCKIFMEFSVLLQLRPFPNFLGSLIHISVSDIFLVDWISGKCFIPTSWLGCCCSILQQTWQRYICTHLRHTWCWPKVCWKKQTKCIKIWSCDYKTLQTVFQR